MIPRLLSGALIALPLFSNGAVRHVTAAEQGQRREVPPSLAELDRVVAIERARAGVDTPDQNANPLVRQKRHHCVRATGDLVLCGCLSDELPVGTSFADYVRVVGTTKDALGYVHLSLSEREGIDTIFAARESCVWRAYDESRN